MAFSRGVLIGLSHGQTGRGDRSLAEHVSFASKVREHGGDALFVSGTPPPTSTDPHVLAGALSMRCGDLLVGVHEQIPSERHPAMIAKLLAGNYVVAGGNFAVSLCLQGERSGEWAEFARAGEAIEVIRAMLRVESPSFHGRYFSVVEAWNEPRLVDARASVPLGVGVVIPRLFVGEGDRGDQRGNPDPVQLGASFADWFLIETTSTDRHATSREIQELREVCRTAGRVESELELVGFIDAADLARASELVESAIGAGLSALHFDARDASDETIVALLDRFPS